MRLTTTKNTGTITDTARMETVTTTKKSRKRAAGSGGPIKSRSQERLRFEHVQRKRQAQLKKN